MESESGGVKSCANCRSTGVKGGAEKMDLTLKSHYCWYFIKIFSMTMCEAGMVELGFHY